MFDPDFDPLQQLRSLQLTSIKQSQNIQQLANGITARGELLTQMIDQIEQQTRAINHLDGVVNELHDRLRLLEIARQYETK